jgi:hypothetical protein
MVAMVGMELVGIQGMMLPITVKQQMVAMEVMEVMVEMEGIFLNNIAVKIFLLVMVVEEEMEDISQYKYKV